MYFDSLTVAAVADELRHKLLNGRVQRVVQVDRHSLGLEIFAGERFQLLATAEPQHPRIYLTDFQVRRGVETVAPLLLLARKHLDGARLAGVEQPPFERLLRLEFSGAEGEATLLVELIERRANLILMQGNQILEAVQRVGPEMNRYRTVLPGRPYIPPPPQPKLDPTDLTELRLRQMLSEAEPDRLVWRVLVANVAGVSPLFARELVFRAKGDAQATVHTCGRMTPLLEAFEEALLPYWEHDWQPGVIVEPDGRVSAFAPYPLTHLGRPERVETISQAAGRYYTHLLGTSAYRAAKEPLHGSLAEARERVRRKRDALARQAPDPAELEMVRMQGELILAYASTIVPGQTELKAQYDPDGPELTIPLDPHSSPVANAQALFREYEKSKRAAADFPERLAAAELELAYLDQLETDLKLAENWPGIDEVREALATAGFLSGPRPSRPRGGAVGPLRVVSDDGLVILVGRNSRQNELVTFKQAAPADLWLHARGAAGGHVVVKSGGRPAPDRTLQQAAQLAAVYSAARNEAQVLVDVTQCKRVRRVKGGKAKPGMVVYTSEQTIRVRPDSAE